MEIKWFNKTEKEGIVTIFKTTITLNVSAAKFFDKAYKVRVGINEYNEIVILPIDKNTYLRGEIDENQLYNIESHSSFSRISNKNLTNFISSSLSIDFYKEPIKFKTLWDEKNNVLIFKERMN
ncbi:MAG: hypothetical protein ACI31G_02075 [Bacilli bacterium]